MMGSRYMWFAIVVSKAEATEAAMSCEEDATTVAASSRSATEIKSDMI